MTSAHCRRTSLLAILTVMCTSVVWLIFMAPISPASAFANDIDQPCLDSVRSANFAFENPGSFPPGFASTTKAGFQDWSSLIDYDGAPLVRVNEALSADDVRVRYVYALPGGLNGQMLCPGDGDYNIAISSNTTSDLDALRLVARHEFGHALGLMHSGDLDAFQEGVRPTMSTCLSTRDPLRGMTVDDRAALSLAHTGLSPRGFGSNVGFEQGTATFLTTGGTLLAETGGGTSNTNHARYDANGTTNFLYQGINYVDAPNKTIRAVVNSKRTGSGDTGVTRVELWARDVNYAPPEPDNTCERYPNGLDMNKRAPAGFWEQKANSTGFLPAATWGINQTPNWYTNDFDGNQDVQVRIFENMTGTGAGSVRLDNVRISCSSNQSEGDCL